MTLPHERSRAIEQTRNFLRELLDPSKTPKIPKAIRTQAYWCLRHFPWDLDINRVAKACPDIFGEIKTVDDEFLRSRLPSPSFGEQFRAHQDTLEPDLPFQEIDGEEFLDSPEPNEKLKKLMKSENFLDELDQLDEIIKEGEK
jgi:hypothetical protein